MIAITRSKCTREPASKINSPSIQQITSIIANRYNNEFMVISFELVIAMTIPEI